MDWQRQYKKLVRFDYIAHAPTQWGYWAQFFSSQFCLLHTVPFT
jgi:hypothetical protein